MNLEFHEKITKLVIIAMFSDDDLMERMVLKGGNALDIIHGVAHRASVDLDFSIEDDFRKEELSTIESKFKKVLNETFRDAGFQSFDINFQEKPDNVSDDVADFWGGYQIELKIIELGKYRNWAHDLDTLRRNALVTGLNQGRKITIDISKHEYCAQKQEGTLDDYRIYFYTPEMIVVEKLRAICQQMPEYRKLVHSHAHHDRARDFFDIYVTMVHFNIDLTAPNNTGLIKDIFSAKRVPLALIGEIHRFKEYHALGFDAVKRTVKIGTELRTFDFYFEYVVKECKKLEALWEKQPPPL